MYYEELIIDSVLHWRGTPDGKWIAKTPEQLTSMLIESRSMQTFEHNQKNVQTYELAPYWTNPEFRLPPVT